MNTDEKINEYERLIASGLTSDMFTEVLERIKQDILMKTVLSPESAIEAHYEYKAIQRIETKINAIANAALIEIESKKHN